MNQAPAGSPTLEQFERQAYGGDHAAAVASLLQLLERLRRRELPTFVAPTADFPMTLQQLATRMASAVVALLTARECGLSAQGVEGLCAYKQQLSEIFGASGFASADLLKALLSKEGADGSRQYDRAALTKLLAVLPLEAADEGLLDASQALGGEVASALLIGFLAQSTCLLPQAEANRQRLLRLSVMLDQLPISDFMAAFACCPWMNCSYSDASDKHVIKVRLNRALRHWLQRKGVAAQLRPRAPRDRPVLLVALEHFRADHAMFRCYARHIEALRERFRLVALVEETEIDASGQALFDEVCQLTGIIQEPLALVAKVQAVSPDVIYFPSLGMSHWTVWLANLRLAPVQVMTLGHPATSASPDMDYCIVGKGSRFAADSFTEKVIELPVSDFAHALHPDLAVVEPIYRRGADRVIVGVPANVLKLSPRMLLACRRLAAECVRPLEFRFFPNTSPLASESVAQQIRRILPNATVDSIASYDRYLIRLNECDIALGTYPFGGSNSTVDCMLLGIPWVAWDGPELHTGSEWPYLEQLGAPPWLRAENEDTFVAAGLRLLQDDEERIAIGRALHDGVTALLQAGDNGSDLGEAFAATIESLYREAVATDGGAFYQIPPVQAR